MSVATVRVGAPQRRARRTDAPNAFERFAPIFSRVIGVKRGKERLEREKRAVARGEGDLVQAVGGAAEPKRREFARAHNTWTANTTLGPLEPPLQSRSREHSTPVTIVVTRLVS
jgi:hypothetical protein